MNILDSPETRRGFLLNSGSLIGLAALSSSINFLGCRAKEEKAEEVTATEDLMREHGVLRRLLLIFDDLEGRLRQDREDTVLFPALRKVVSPGEFNELGDKFEDQEEARFGKGGYEKIVTQVAGLEKVLGIGALAQFTPQV